MLIIFSYDIKNSKERSKILNKCHKICSRYLFQIQYSVFYGELNSSLLKELIFYIKNIIDEKLDSIIIIKVKNKNNSETIWIGKNQNFNNIL